RGRLHGDHEGAPARSAEGARLVRRRGLVGSIPNLGACGASAGLGGERTRLLDGRASLIAIHDGAPPWPRVRDIVNAENVAMGPGAEQFCGFVMSTRTICRRRVENADSPRRRPVSGPKRPICVGIFGRFPTRFENDSRPVPAAVACYVLGWRTD